MDLATPTRLLDKYDLERLIGRGGMGNVYAARHVAMDRPVAIKFLRPELMADDELVQRFTREVIATARIANPYVVSVYDIDRLPDGTYFIVMDMLRGETLRQRLERGPIPREECVDILVETAAALGAAHAAGVIHRDLKPENVFLTVEPVPQVKVVDFGIAKLEGSETFTAINAVLGTPAYMAPEQLVSMRNSDQRSDLWSLGVMAFEMLAGRPPFSADSIPGLCAAILAGEPPNQDELGEMDAALRAAVMRCLSRDPAQRHASAAGFAQEIARFGTPRAQHALDVMARGSAGPCSEAAATLPNARASSPAGAPVEAQPSQRCLPRQRWLLRAAQASALGVVVLAFAWFWPGVGRRIMQQAGMAAREPAAATAALGSGASRALAPRPVTRFVAEADGRSIDALGFSVDGLMLATFSAESGRVRLRSTSAQTELRTLRAEGVERVYFGVNGYALTKSADGVLTQWSLLSGVSTGASSMSEAIAFAGSLDLGLVVVTAERELLRLPELGRRGDALGLPLDPSGVLAVRSDRKRAVVGSLGPVFLYVDLQRKQITKLDTHGKSALSAAMFLMLGGSLITGDNEGRILIWDPPNPQPVFELPRVDGPVLGFSSDASGKLVLVAGTRELILFDPATRVTRRAPLPGVVVRSARLSFDASQVAVGTDAGEVLVFATSSRP